MIKACIFDLDGTLLDTLESIRVRLSETLSLYGLSPIDRDKTRAFVGDGARELVKRALLHSGAEALLDDLQGITGIYVDGYNAKPYDLTLPYEGIPEALLTLKGAGVKLAVLSNKPHSTVRLLCERFFSDIFDIVIGARAGVALKPSAEAVYGILKELEVEPDETAYFGDTAVDMETARAYGAGMCCGVLWGFRDREELLEAGATTLLSRADEIADTVLLP